MRKAYAMLTVMISLLLCSCTSAAREENAALETMENLALLFEKARQ